MPQVVPCPACGQQLKLPDALLGKSVKCKCSHVFTAPLPTTTCPVCSAAVPEDATACPDCGYHFAAPPPLPPTKADDRRQAQRLPEPGLRDPQPAGRAALPAVQHARCPGPSAS